MANLMTGQIDVVMNSTGVDAEIARLQRNIDNFGSNVTRSGKKAGEGFNQVNAKVKDTAYQVDAATTRVAQSIVKQAVAMESGGRQAAEYYRQMAQLNGLNASFLTPYIQRLEQAEAKNKSFIGSINNVKTAFAGFAAFVAGGVFRQLASMSDEYTVLNSRGILQSLLPSNRILRTLYRRGWIRSFFDEKAQITIKNKLSCESHLELMAHYFNVVLKL